MDSQIFLAPASRSTSDNRAFLHLQRTVLDGLPAESFSEDFELVGREPVRIWGLKSSVKSEWELVDSGDWFLFYTDSNAYEYAAKVIDTEFNPDRGDKIREEFLDLHENELDSNWDCLVYFDDPVNIDVSGGEVADIFGYGNDYPVRFIRVTSDRIVGIENEFGGISEFIDFLKS